MRELDKIAENLFNKIRTRFENVNLGDENAKHTEDPQQARFINFDYVDSAGKNYGNVTISIIDETGLKIYFSKNITDALEGEEQDNWFNFLKGIRRFAKANLLSFDVRDITKSNLDLRDLKQQSKSDSTYTDDEVTMNESKMWGTSRSSYQEMGPARIIVRHSNNVDEEKRGSRSRNIEAVFIENHVGERRLLDFKNLHGARAMAQHCSQGGSVDDELGESITSIVKEMGAMSHFVREAKRRQFEDTETSSMAQAAVQRYGELKNQLKHLGGRRGYDSYKQAYNPGHDIEEEIDVDALRERFVKKVYDDRFTEALPYVYKAYKDQQKRMHTPMGEEFEQWANDITEDAFESDDEEYAALSEIMSKPINAGQDGLDASQAIARIFSEESLEEKLVDLGRTAGPDADARQTILDWMRANGMTIVADKIQAEIAPENTAPTAGTAPAEPAPAGAQQMAAPVPPEGPTTNESKDPLDVMKRLANLFR
jgi:hypothetical protein